MCFGILPRPIGGGSVSEKGRQTFEGNAYNLIKHSAPVPKKVYGAPWDENVEEFWANHYFKPAGPTRIFTGERSSLES